MSTMATVDGTAFAALVVGVVLVGLIVALVLGLTGPSAHEEIGRGGLSEEPEAGGSRAEDEREEEIRQLIDARRERSARRTRAGARPGPSAPERDPGLADELRQLAVACNARRLRRGLEPIDVDEEVARRLREL